MRNSLSPIALITLFLLLGLTMTPLVVIADTDIGNGKLFTCDGTTIIAVKTSEEVTAKKAIAKYKRIIRKKTQLIKRLSGKKRKKAVRAKKAAKRGFRDTRSCRDGELASSSLSGTWNLTFENGQAPTESGYTSLVEFTASNTFTSNLTGPVSCHWEGSYSSTDDLATVTLLTTVGNGTGGAACTQAIGKERTATVSFSDDGNTLTMDFRPNGALQVFERVS